MCGHEYERTGFKIRSVERWRFGAGGGQLCDASLGGELLPEARRQVLGNGSKQALANVHQEDESEAKSLVRRGNSALGTLLTREIYKCARRACTRATTQKGSGIANWEILDGDAWPRFFMPVDQPPSSTILIGQGLVVAKTKT